MTASASVVLDVAAKYLREQYGASHGLDHPVDRARIIALLPHPAEQDAREAVARIVEDAAREGIRNYCLDRTDFTAAPFVRRILTLTQAAPDGWRPIETAPKDGTPVDLLIEGERWPEYSWSEKRNAWTKEVGYPTRTSVIMTKPTHYFVVPAPPAQGAGG